MTVQDKFLKRITPEPNSGCWLWTGYVTAQGYGACYAGGYRNRPAHRVAYELFKEVIPDGLDLDHLCRVRHCVNPSHLEAVDRRTNLLRGITIPAARARQTHCVNGHEFTPENTMIRRGCRECRACTLAAKRRAWHQQSPAQRDRANLRRRIARRVAMLAEPIEDLGD